MADFDNGLFTDGGIFPGIFQQVDQSQADEAGISEDLDASANPKVDLAARIAQSQFLGDFLGQFTEINFFPIRFDQRQTGKVEQQIDDLGHPLGAREGILEKFFASFVKACTTQRFHGLAITTDHR
ncbi:MAG: hypothetical protein P8X63_01145 [Desulfuromonadaceae bacterium]